MGGEELAVMSYVVCCIKLEADYVPCGRSAAPSDRSVTGDMGESGLLIVSLRLGCIQVAMIHWGGQKRVRESEMAIAQQYSDRMNIYNQSG